MNREEKANSYHDNGYNCCQAVSAAFSDRTGLSEAQALAIAGGFGGGLRCGEVCGAVSGAVMVLSLMHPYMDSSDMDSKKRIAALTREFDRRFREEFGCLRCLDLLGADISTDELMQKAKAEGKMANCHLFIAGAVRIVEQMMEEERAGTL